MHGCNRPGSDSEINRELCQGLADAVINAGGEDLFIEAPCPIEFLRIIGPEQTDPHRAEVRSRLGIVGYFEDAEAWF